MIHKHKIRTLAQGFLLLCVLCGGAGLCESGSVVPLPGNSAATGGVKSLLGNERVAGSERSSADKPKIKNVFAEGWATIQKGNIDQARIKALQMAYAEAVGRVCGIDIGSLMIVRNVKQVSDVVMSRSRGFVRAYTIVNEGVAEKDSTRYEIRIDAEVIEEGTSVQDEKDGLRLYLALLGDPVLLIMLPEKTDRPNLDGSATSTSHSDVEVESNDTRIKVKKYHANIDKTQQPENTEQAHTDQGSVLRGAEAALAQAFSAYGYQVITSDDLLSSRLVEPQVLKDAKNGVTAQAVKVAKAANADIALLGIMRLSTRSVKPAGVDLFLTTAEASAKALIVSSGKTIQAFHQSQRASSPDALAAYSDCLDRVATEMADVLAWKIPQILNQDSRKTKLTIHGVDMAKVYAIKRSIGEITGVEMVQISKLPTADQSFSELAVFTGFVKIPNGEIFDICSKEIGSPLTILNENKYEIELKPKNKI